MTIAAYDLVTLIEVVNNFKVVDPFWLKFFTRQINFEGDKIAFDRVNIDYRRRAPFVAPNVQGKVLALEGYDTVEFKPAYVKPKHVVDYNTVLVRRPGEAMNSGSLSNAQRRDAVIADILKRHAEMHKVTQEWMAARAIIDGKVTISGENYPAVTVDFLRDATQTVVLTGTAKWDAPSTALPLADIAASRNNTFQLCGVGIQDLVFGRNAAALFTARTDVKDLLNTQIRGTNTTISLVRDGFEDSVEYIGELVGSNGQGAIRLWMYNGKYRDENNALQDILDTNTVVGVSAAVEGVRCFGAIKDKGAQYRALEMFPKMWEEEDPSVEYVMTQSAPLMVPRVPNATFSIKVA